MSVVWGCLECVLDKVKSARDSACFEVIRYRSAVRTGVIDAAGGNVAAKCS